MFVPTTNIDGTEGCGISNEYELTEISQLLSLNEQVLLNCLTKSGPSWNQLDNGSELDAENASILKLALCRTLYGRLFTYILNRINETLKVSKNLVGIIFYIANLSQCFQLKHFNRGKNLGILDFYGFEVLEENSFEQLMLNYCQERLHQSFTHNVLKHQQDLYAKEGLEWTKLDYFDNQTVCELIDKVIIRITGIFSENVN